MAADQLAFCTETLFRSALQKRTHLHPVSLCQFFLQLQHAAVSVGEEILGPLGATETGRLASLEGSLFEALLALLERLRGDMQGRLQDAVMRDVKEKAQPYCKDR